MTDLPFDFDARQAEIDRDLNVINNLISVLGQLMREMKDFPTDHDPVINKIVQIAMMHNTKMMEELRTTVFPMIEAKQTTLKNLVDKISELSGMCDSLENSTRGNEQS